MLITSAETSHDRAEVQAFFETVFSGIAPDAVPSVQYDSLYEPVILMVRDDAGSGRIVAAVLSCRTTEIAGIIGFSGENSPIYGTAHKVAPLHSNLDLIATEHAHRNAGLASALLSEVEGRLIQRGVRVWFGRVTDDLDADRLRQFYLRHGFLVLDDGEPLPPFFGFDGWNVAPETVRFSFYKRLRAQNSE